MRVLVSCPYLAQKGEQPHFSESLNLFEELITYFAYLPMQTMSPYSDQSVIYLRQRDLTVKPFEMYTLRYRARSINPLGPLGGF